MGTFLLDLINWLGENTWGNIPPFLYPWFFIFLIIVCYFLLNFIAKSLPKTKAENVRMEMLVINNKIKSVSSDEIAYSNAKILIFLRDILYVLIFFLVLPVIGIIANSALGQGRYIYEDRPVQKIYPGEKIVANFRGFENLYTCTKTTNETVFTYEEIDHVMREQDEKVLFKIISSKMTMKINWYGDEGFVKEIRQPYICVN